MGTALKGYQKAGRVIRVLGWIGFVATFLVALAVFFGVSAAAKEIPAGMSAGMIGVGFLVIGGALCWFQLFLGKAVMDHKEWARVTSIVIYALNLFAFPIGTAIGAYILWQLWKGWDEPAAPNAQS